MEDRQDHYQDQNHSDFNVAVWALWKRDEWHTYGLSAHLVFSLTHPERWLYNLIRKKVSRMVKIT